MKRKLGTILILMLAFVVFASTTAMADATISITQDGTNPAQAYLDNPQELCVVTVNGLEANEEATILVYDDDSVNDLADITNSDILYIKQTTADSDGVATFSFYLRDKDTAANYNNASAIPTRKVAVGHTNASSVTYETFSVYVAAPVESVEVIGVDDLITSGTTQAAAIASAKLRVNYSDSSIEPIEIPFTDDRVSYSFGEASDPIVAGGTLTGTLNISTPPYDEHSYTVYNATDARVTYYADKDSTSAYRTAYVAHEFEFNLPSEEEGELPTKAGYQFIGWGATYTENEVVKKELYAKGASFTVPEGVDSVEFRGVWADIEMISGASMRVASPAGLKFSTLIDKAYFDDLLTYDSSAVYGTLIAPANYVDLYLAGNAANFTMEGLDSSEAQNLPEEGKRYMQIINTMMNGTALDEGALDGYGIDSISARQIDSVISGITYKTAGRLYAGRGFIGFTYYGENAPAYVYADYSKTNNARSIRTIARKTKYGADAKTSVDPDVGGYNTTAYYDGLTDEYAKTQIDFYDGYCTPITSPMSSSN